MHRQTRWLVRAGSDVHRFRNLRTATCLTFFGDPVVQYRWAATLYSCDYIRPDAGESATPARTMTKSLN